MNDKKNSDEFEIALRNVIAELKAPKGQYNSFGKYAYRNAEDILEAVKPLLHKYSLRMKISDTIYNQGNRYYVEATVSVSGFNTFVEATGVAREAESKKGMDEAQITGAASSYARKHALNGMFCIDDTKDADSNEQREQIKNKPAEKSVYITDEQRVKIAKLFSLQGVLTTEMPTILQEHYSINPGDDITYLRAEEIIKDLEK